MFLRELRGRFVLSILVAASGASSLGCWGAIGGDLFPEAPVDGAADANGAPRDAGAEAANVAASDGGDADSALTPADAQPDGGPRITGDKVDLLFMIDNSSSMGDKQDYLEAAIPDLIRRFVTPNCVDPNNPSIVLGVSQGNGYYCAAGVLEFAPVHDMHVGVVSSSLGPRLGDSCQPGTISIGGATLDQHNDDQGHLLTRSSTPGASPPTESPLPDAASGFLAWFPATPANVGPPPAVPIGDIARLETDFADLVSGVHQYGCGIESQLESWYRFLIQPDPYQTLALDASQRATWQGVDATILKQRHDFLRPDSVVAIVDLTDENDSEIDVRSLGGTGYAFMAYSFKPSRGTSACATNPADPLCQNCVISGSTDPSCAQGPYSSITDWGYDLNLRHVHMKAKYGVDPQYPIARYVTGLTSPRVPDRSGEYPAGAGSYVGTNDCTNPLFAASLPDGSSTDPGTLCNLPPGPRPPGLVFFAHVGGVPQKLLHFDPTDPGASQLTAADWVKILGRDPQAYDYTGIDPHMIESYAPRAGLPDPSQPDGADPISGREWITDVGLHSDSNVDLEYACTFRLGTTRDCTLHDNALACSCSSTGLSHAQTSPICDPNTPTKQVGAKAYPTVRELLLAKLLGPQAVVASICPLHVSDNAAKDDPLYGYRPAMTGLVNAIKGALAP